MVATALAVCMMVWTVNASAQDAVTGESIEVHATFNHVGIQLTISGDGNRNATAALEVDVAGAGFVAAHRLSRALDDRFVGSAFWLPEDTAFEVRVTLSDADGVTNETLTATGTTRALSVPASAGTAYHVAPGGDDNGAGTESAPFATVARGIQQAQPGDSVLVHAGTYHEEVDVTSGGSSGSPITLRAAGDGPAIMDGADPGLKSPSAWSDAGGGIYTASVVQTRYVSVDGVRLWRYENLADLQSLSLGTAGGFFFDGSTVHVRLPGDAAPAGHEIQVSTLGRALWLEAAPHFVVQGMTFRCYGGETYSQAIMVRDGSHNVWIVDNDFENVMPGIWVKNDVDDLTVMDNRFSDVGLAEFPWHEVKAQGGMESGGLAIDGDYDGQGIVFLRNVVHDTFDGLNICGDQPMGHPNNADVLENLFVHAADDGIETDGECSNIRILQNRFEDMLVGVSTAPAVTGPTYVFRNVIAPLHNVAPDSDWSVRAMKFNVGDPRPSGDVFAYHNTAVTYEAEQAAWTVTDDSDWSAVHLVNNIWVGTDYAFYHQNTGDEPFFEDYDLMFSSGDRLVRHQGNSYDTISEYFSATGLCEHCQAGDPLFVDGSGGDYHLTESSPAVDQGVVIEGVNDGFVGAGPDMGALELGGDDPGWPDAGPLPDGGTSSSSSGSSSSGTGPGGDVEDGGDSGGCGCGTVASRGAPATLLLALLLMGLHQRRARRESS
ncbi:MAG: right-handed parallel beta-helix repeat-containing protein [Deltaproteobacteria bacterium]|nr:right-handed parallel beta-helix repeat-containing protein [Deltaproteobacteria bacterium]